MMPTIYIRQIRRVGKNIRRSADPGATHVAYCGRHPVADISHQDGKYWSRQFGAPRSVAYRPYFPDQTLVDVANEISGDVINDILRMV